MLAAGCARKDRSAADARRIELEDYEGKDKYAPELAKILSDKREDDFVRAIAATYLGEIPAGIEHASVLVAAIDDDNPEVRRASVKSCGELAIPEALVPAGARLKLDTDVAVRRAAAITLGQLRGDAAIAALVEALEDKDPGVQVMAAVALQAATGNLLGDDPEVWRKWAAGRTK